MTMSRDFKGIWIPREIWFHPELTIVEKSLWAEIHSLNDREMGGCWASNAYLSGFIGMSERYVREIISKLEKLDLIERVDFNGRTRTIRAKLPREDLSSIDDRNYSSGLPGTEALREEPQFRSRRNHSSTKSSSSKKVSKNKDNIVRKSANAASEPALRFNFETKEFEGISEKDISDWKEAYPLVDIRKEIAEAREWCKANPKAKMKSLWRKFLNGWFAREQEKMVNQKARESSYSQKPSSVSGNACSPSNALFADRVRQLYPERPGFVHGRNYFEWSFGQDNYTRINYTDHGFQEQVINKLRKLGWYRGEL